MGNVAKLDALGTPARPARSALELWGVINERGGLAPETHDKALLDELRLRLSMPAGQSIPEYLDAANVSATDFLIALVGATGPWAQMLSGMYAMFERHGLVQSNDGVVLEFDFNRTPEALKFTSDHFKRAGAAYRRLTRLVEQRKFVAGELHELLNVIPRLVAKANGFDVESDRGCQDVAHRGGRIVSSCDAPESIEVRTWLGMPRGNAVGMFWPYLSSPPFPPNVDALGDVMTPLKVVATALCDIASAYPGWKELEEGARKDKSAGGIGQDVRGFVQDWSLSKALYSQHDWLGPNLAKLMWQVFELAPRDPEQRTRLAAEIHQAIDARSDVETVQIEDNVLEDLLDLPLWKQRHQLYSVWLLTVMERAVPEGATFRLVHEHGKLVFNFSPTVVAIVEIGSTKLEWISELRTAARDFVLVGEGRKDAVQPDYVLRHHGDEQSALYVLEAKQYRWGDKENFSQALYDYAGVHENARVALANYGSMPRSVSTTLSSLAADLERRHGKSLRIPERCKTFGKVRPGEGLAVEALRLSLVEALDALPAYQRPRLVVDVTTSMHDFVPGPDDELGGLWTMFSHWNGPVSLIANVFIDELPDGKGMMDSIRRHSFPARLDLGALPASELGGSVLLTDQAGYEETKPGRDCFSVVVVMTGREEAKAYLGAEFGSELFEEFRSTGCVRMY